MTFGKIWEIPTPRSRELLPNESLINEWTALETLWLVAKQGNPAPSSKSIADIDELFANRTDFGNAEGWKLYNECEQRVGQELTAEQLPVEFAGLLDIAKARGVQFATHEARQPTFQDAAKIKDQKAAYQALLYELQSNFINGRFVRKLHSEVASRLFWYGVSAILLAVAVPALFVHNYYASLSTHPAPGPKQDLAMTLFSQEPVYGLVMVVSFGILGALFSRIISFQDLSKKLTFDEVMRSFIGRVLRIRLLVGMISAIIFYFLLRGGLVAGSVFPDLKRIGLTEQPVWLLGDDGSVLKASGHFARAGLTILAPTTDLAKLLIWSFLAGFSERLVPDALARTEAQGTKAST